MTAEIFNIRDYRRREELKAMEQRAAEILKQVDTSPSEMIPYHHGVDALYQAPEKDPA